MPKPSIRIPHDDNTITTTTSTLRAKTLREQQTILGLQALAQQDDVSSDVLGNGISDLTDKLILGAGEDVLELAEREEREQLEVFQRLVTRRLGILRGGDAEHGYEEKKNTKNSRERNGAGKMVVNGAGSGKRNGNEDGSRSATPRARGVSKSTLASKSTPISKSRERRAVSRGRN